MVARVAKVNRAIRPANDAERIVQLRLGCRPAVAGKTFFTRAGKVGDLPIGSFGSLGMNG
jgi:hypothetical protein